MKIFGFIIFLLIGLSGWGQKTPYGIIVEFNSTTPSEYKSEIIDQIHELQAYNPLLELNGFDIYLACFNQDLSESQAVLIQKDLENNNWVSYTSILYRTKDNAFGGNLSEIFVQFHSTPHSTELRDLQILSSCESISPYNGIDNTFILKFDKSVGKTIEDITSTLRDTETYRYVCPNTFHSVQVTTNDPYYDFQWALNNTGSADQFDGDAGADMSVSDAWTYNMGEPYIKVAVLDSGTDTNHVDLINNLLPGFDATGGGSLGYPNTNYSNDGHGTSCAGIVAAEADNNEGVAGVAPNCKVIPVKIFYYINIGQGPIPFASVSAGIDGIIWAVDTAKADVLSNSWGLRDQDIDLLGVDTSFYNQVIIDKIISGRYGKGIPMLFSSGNDAANGSIWPAKHYMTISVGASTMCDELKTTNDCSPENWWGGNYGDDLDVTAPGVKVLTTDHSGSDGFNSFTDNDYTYFNGTSAACPNAAGVMALILSEDSTLNYFEARELISITAEKVGGYNYGYPGIFGAKSTEMGYGRVNALGALQYMYSTTSINEASSLGEIRYLGEKPFLHFESTSLKEINIFNSSGQLVQTIISADTDIFLEGFSAGIYVCQVSNELDVSRYKFVVQ